jgi:uncharacterized membrane protein YuzA (DUF378 family)
MKVLDMIALALVIIGGLNWLLVGLFEFDLVASIFGSQEDIGAKIVYILVGLAALYSLKFFGLINDHHEIADRSNRTTATGTTGTGTTGTTDATDATDTTKGADARTAGVSDRNDTVDPTKGSTKNKTVDADTRTGADTRDVEDPTDKR